MQCDVETAAHPRRTGQWFASLSADSALRLNPWRVAADSETRHGASPRRRGSRESEDVSSRHGVCRAMRGEFTRHRAVPRCRHSAIKVASFGSAVNVTLGLPFPRTSPDHGTALDIAGQDCADASSMIAATLLCASIVARARSLGGRPAYGDRPTDSRSGARPSPAR